MTRVIVAGLLMLGCAAQAYAVSWFEDYEPEVVGSDPYLELRTGPGRGFPVFHVAGMGESVTVLKTRTDWFKVRAGEPGSPREKLGWVHADQLASTLDGSGTEVQVQDRSFEDYAGRRWETGITGGDFGGASSLSAYVGYALTPNISLQVEATQILGDFSDGIMGTGNIIMSPFPNWRVSPFFTLGAGIIRVEPHTTIVQAEDRQDEIVHAGLGTNVYLSDRFVLRLEYKRHTVLTSRDDNEEIDQWKAGFSVFF